MSRRVIAALAVAAGLAGCGGTPPPDRATSEAQVGRRMLEYNLLQITPQSGARLCSLMAPDRREAWKEEGSETLRDLLPASVTDCESHWDHLISSFMLSPGVVEMIRTAQLTHVEVSGERATATLTFGGTFKWRWQDGQWLMDGHSGP